MRGRSISQIFFYLLVGGGAALTYVLICTWLVKTGLRPGIASVIGYVVVIIPAYFGQKSLTFRSQAWHRIAFPKYLALQVAGNIAGFVLSEALSARGLPSWMVFGAAAVIVATTNFLVMKYWTFRGHA